MDQMRIARRAYTGKSDQQQMQWLVHRAPAEHLHWLDLPYRFSSWALDAPENVGLWTDQRGELVAWAVLQTPFWSIDTAVDPEAKAILAEVLAWADRRARQARDTSFGRPMWFVNLFSHQAEQIRAIEAAGFTCQADAGDDSWSKVLLSRHPAAPLPDAPVPAGFVLRPLAGVKEVPAYVRLHRAVFQSTSMTEAWRLRTLRRAEYLPDLDLVVVAPRGDLAAFCIGWLGRSASGAVMGQIEPLGVDEAYRGRGLGRALLAAVVRHLISHGAEQVSVETDRRRGAAMGLYQALQFQVLHDILVYRKEYPP